MPNSYLKINREINQGHELRRPFLREIKKLREGRMVLSFFISFRSQQPLTQTDADMIEEVLCNADASRGVTLLLDAPGGDGLAAERIIQVCRKYSGRDFETIVPGRAKSAATMVCLGSDRILMGPTSELGPIDPQVPMQLRGELWEWVAAQHVVETYDELIGKAVALKEGHIEPYLQQLSKFNAITISQLRNARDLAESIAVASLRKGMLKGRSQNAIKRLIRPFTDPKLTMSHGRALTADQLQRCHLNIEVIEHKSPLWAQIRDLYMRSKFFVDSMGTPRKLIETVDISFNAS